MQILLPPLNLKVLQLFATKSSSLVIIWRWGRPQPPLIFPVFPSVTSPHFPLFITTQMPVQGRHRTAEAISVSWSPSKQFFSLHFSSQRGPPDTILSLSGILDLAIELTNFSPPYMFTYKYACVFLNGVVDCIIFRTLLLSPLKYLGHHLIYRFPEPNQSVFLEHRTSWETWAWLSEHLWERWIELAVQAGLSAVLSSSQLSNFLGC